MPYKINIIDRPKAVGHASKPPSASTRIILCAISYILTKFLPEGATSVWAAMGSKVHAILEDVNRYVFNNSGQLPEFDTPVTDVDYYDQERIYKNVTGSALYFYNACLPYLDLPHKIFFEQKLVMDEARDIWGTGDNGFLSESSDTVKIIIQDHKEGVKPVTTFEQLIHYAWALLNEVEDFTDKKVLPIELIIYQPNIENGIVHKTYTYEELIVEIKKLDDNYKKIESWEAIIGEDTFQNTITEPLKRLLPLIEAGVDVDAHWKAGECRYCKANYLCPKFKENKKLKTLKVFKEVSKGEKFPGEKKRAEQKALIKAYIAAAPEHINNIIDTGLMRSNLTTFAQACYDFVLDFARDGKPLGDTKLVETESNDYLDVSRIGETNMEKELLRLGVIQPSTSTKKFIGITQLKTLLKREAFEHLLGEKQVGYKCVRDDDDREPVDLKSKVKSKVLEKIKG